MQDDSPPKKREIAPIERFKGQNKLLREFGEVALRVFSAIDGEKTAEEIMTQAECTPEEYEKIISFMESLGMVEGGVAHERLEEKTGYEDEAKPAMEEEPAQIEPVKKPEEGKRPGRKPGKEPEEAQAISPEEPKMISPQEPGETPAPRKKPAGKAKTGLKEKKVQAGIEEERAEGAEPKTQDRGPKTRDSGLLETKDSGRIAPQISPSRFREPEKTKEDKEMEGLSPLEKRVYAKYGAVGVKVYSLIDGEKTAEQILLETGISEVKLVEILEFLESEGIIKLEKPAGAGSEGGKDPGYDAGEPSGFGGGAGEGGAGKSMGGFGGRQTGSSGFGGRAGEGGPGGRAGGPESDSSSSFGPMIEEKPDYEEEKAPPKDEEAMDIVPIDSVFKARMDFMREASVQAGLMLKYKAPGGKIYELLGRKKDTVELAIGTRMSLEEIDSVLAYLGEQKAAYFKGLGREEIRKKYGDDGLAVYKRFGREGVLLYELVGREKSLKNVVIASRIAPKRAVEILLFIHTVLNLDIPINSDALYKELGIAPG